MKSPISLQPVVLHPIASLVAGSTALLAALLMSHAANAAPPVPGTQAFCTSPLFPELPASLKCVQVPQPYQLDANGNPTPANLFEKDASGAFIMPPKLKPPATDPTFAATSTLPTLIKNKAAAIALGKALFWDQQVGSDGESCASCHYKAGADDRIKNQINPGMRNASGKTASDGVTPIGNVFNFLPSAPSANDALPPAPNKGPNYTLKKADFPLRKYQERDTVGSDGFPPQMDRNAALEFDSDDVISSQGVYKSDYNKLSPLGFLETCNRRFPKSGPDMPLFNVRGVSVRQVEPRNSPSVVNAVFNHRNFWDGRANNVFNGLDPFGMRRPFPMPASASGAAAPTEIQVWDATKKKFTKVRIAVFNASLASQAVGPALSDFEMSCGGKTFPELAKKMLKVIPLGLQNVSKTDSVLGSKAGLLTGLSTTYTAMIQAAFVDNLWNAPAASTLDGYTQLQNNFSLFWGLAIAAYESTLVSDDTKFDQAQEGRAVLTEAELRGKSLFADGGKGKCTACHSGPEFTAASVRHVQGNPGIGTYVQRMLMGDGGVALYDAGYYNIGVRPSSEDVGVGGADGYGNPLSFARNAKTSANGYMVSPLGPDPFNTNSAFFDPTQPNLNPVETYEREAVDGAFKTPGLRNVELTGPFFHNGGYATLEQVIQFYNRGGDRDDLFQKNGDGSPVLAFDYTYFAYLPVPADSSSGLLDSTGLKDASGNGWSSNLAPNMAGAKDPLLEISGFPMEKNLQLTAADVADLVAYLKTLTDDRVRYERAPFDHPSLIIPDGHPGNEAATLAVPLTSIATPSVRALPTVGKAGRTTPYLPFEAGLK